MKRRIVLITLLAAAWFLWLVPLAYSQPDRSAVFTVGQNSFIVNGQERGMDAETFVENSRTYVPLRYLAYAVGIDDRGIGWDSSSQTVTLDAADIELPMVQLQVGSREITVGSYQEFMDVPPLIRNGRTYLPARYVAEAFGFEVGWDSTSQALLLGPSGSLPKAPVPVWDTRYEQRYVETSCGTKTVNLVYVNMDNRSVELRPVLANDRIGSNEDLAAMAWRVGAAAAINGTYFNAYDANDLMPHGTLEINHSYYHLGSNAALGITDDNRALIGAYTPAVNGSTDGSYAWPHWWYAWAINHAYSDDGIVIFTPEYKNGYTPNGSTCIVVRGGVVTGITSGSTAIPVDGYVIWYGLNNYERSDQFSIGTSVDYKITYGENGQADFKSSIGNYPLLISGARNVVGDVSDQKLTIEAPRSFAGVTGDNIFVMGTVDAANVWGLAEVAQNLGLRDALNLDGGASTGLYYNGEYVTAPGRLLSNCLAVIIK